MKFAARAALALSLALPVVAGALDDATRVALEGVVAGSQRSAQHRARDGYRHPVQTLLFFGIRADMTVVELYPGAGGWYTEILAPFLHDHGTFYAAGYDPQSTENYYPEECQGLRRQAERRAQALRSGQNDRARVPREGRDRASRQRRPRADLPQRAQLDE